MTLKRLSALFFCLLAVLTIMADDGHHLWLRSSPVKTHPSISCKAKSPTARLAAEELRAYWQGSAITLKTDSKLPDNDGFTITADRKQRLVVAARHDVGLLYAAYTLLRLQTLPDNLRPALPLQSAPAFGLRLLNHWDNLDGSVERGYAGRSIFWGDASIPTDETLREYARANASVGINGTVLNNVNASPKVLDTANLLRIKHWADVMRPYGIRVYLSVNFASPMVLGGLTTADPLNDEVARWWRNKVDEIYQLIPDFGGLLVKANSEGQPGPGDYKRTHAQGANMLADALQPHGGIVMWRAFVYGYHDNEDRVKKAVSEFKPLDGQFRPNVILQVKNGPLDFQPREPYSPLFDQMHQTPLMPELQITQEYTGQSRHLVYLGPLWQEFFSFVKPYLPQPQRTQGSPSAFPAIAGVANIGSDANWCGHHFSQANWYSFGRLSWDPTLSSEAIAREWLIQTFTSDNTFVEAMTTVMEQSREACVDYMMPLGLHHIFMDDHHYGPYPEGNRADFPDEWKPVWYHKADSLGIGFNRSSSGTNATAQYRSPYRELYDNVATCPDEYLLWFHHLPWDYTMRDGSTLWQSLSRHYKHGVEQVDAFVNTWKTMSPYVDEQRYAEVLERLLHQQQNAREWCDHCLGYFQKMKDGQR